MSEGFWLQIANLVVTAILSGFVWWLRRTHTKDMHQHDELDIIVSDKVDATVAKLDFQKVKLDQIHTEINGKMLELVRAKVDQALAEERLRIERDIRDSVPKAVADALNDERARVAKEKESK